MRKYRQTDSAFLGPYVQRRYRVLFEVWFKGQREVEITSQLCENCGFVLYTPRPEDADLDAKYRFLDDLDQDVGLPADAPVAVARARQLYWAVTRLARRRPEHARVLDFGGGDGCLMRKFVAAGCQCDVLDYSKNSIAGVRKVGDTLSDLSEGTRYDWIVCSHVIEHVAEPQQIVEQLSRHLADEGLLYVEVPMEIWGRAPLQEDPVTHVNFFTPASLRYLLLQVGLRVERVRLGGYLHPTGRQLLAVRAVARPALHTAGAIPPGCAEVERFLNPGLRERVWRYMLTPLLTWMRSHRVSP